jgi:hypothetical protein
MNPMWIELLNPADLTLGDIFFLPLWMKRGLLRKCWDGIRWKGESDKQTTAES